MSNTQLPLGINAWIFLNEDEPAGTNYNSPTSCFQSLINYKVYDSINLLGIAFFEVVHNSNGSTIQVGNATHPGNSENPNDSLSNQQYLEYVLRDAREVNPDIKFLATMVYSGNNTLASVFTPGGNAQDEATAFANNLVTYLKANGMNGLDVDWEGDVSARMTQTQFQILFSTIRSVFDQQSEKFYLTIAPAWSSSTYDFPTLNSAFDVISPQFYDGTPLSSFLNVGMSPSKIGYGAQFEPGNAVPNASAQQVWDTVSAGFDYQGSHYNYQDIFMWRLNSGNFQFEQGQLLILSELAYPETNNSFDDSDVVFASGSPNISQLTVRSGDVLNAVQTVNTGTGTYNTGTQPPGTDKGVFTLLQHGGNSGASQTVNIPSNDPIVSISGYTGVWYGTPCVLQLTLTGQSGTTYGPFGSMAGATSKTPFTQTGPNGQTVVGFKGSTVGVTLAGGEYTNIIANLDAIFSIPNSVQARSKAAEAH
ncbi:glycosyl hydrolase family 18 protein [Tenacibaculum xiamenense]|uniref:glycosyl hydrolase family 18 protein n=1 Tax=Tenacibaculum xiamenense TaxID=1261553 RepID=UPI0038950D2F